MTLYRYHEYPSRTNQFDIGVSNITELRKHIASKYGIALHFIQETQDQRKAENASKAWAVYIRQFTPEQPTLGGGSIKPLELAASFYTYLIC